MTAPTSLPDFAFDFTEINETTAPILAETSLEGSTALVPASAWTGSITKAAILGAKTPTGKYMQLYIVAGGWTDSTHIVITTRPLKQDSDDINTADTANDFDLPAGTKIYPVVSNYHLKYLAQAILGTISNGSLLFTIGTNTDSTVTINHAQSGSTVGWLRNNISTGKAQFSNDGTTWVNFDNAGVGVLTGGDGISITGAGATINVDTTDTDVFVKTSSGAADENKVPVLNADGDIADGFIPSTIARDSELSGISPTDGTTLTGGAASDADALHTHSNVSAPVAVKAGTTTTLWTDATEYDTASTSYVSKGATKVMNFNGNMTFSVALKNSNNGQNASLKTSYTDAAGTAASLELTSDTSATYNTKTGTIYPAIGSNITFELKASANTAYAKDMFFKAVIVNADDSKIL